MIMIVKTPGSQMGSPAAAGGGGEAVGGGRGEIGERREVQSRSSLTKSEIKVERSCDPGGSAEDFAFYDGNIRANIGTLVDTVKARGGTASQKTRRSAVIRSLTLCSEDCFYYCS